MIPEFVRELGAWNSLVGGLLLLGLEVLAPGAFLMWFGIAALIVGLLALAFVIAWQAQAILFVVLAIALVLVGRRVFSRARRPGDLPGLNDRATRLVGHAFPLTEAIASGTGRIKVEDSTWGVAGPDLPAGTRVRVIGHDGAVLHVVAD